MNINRVYESVLYAQDLDAAADFYTRVVGLPLLSQNELMLVLAVGDNYLLIFNPEKSSPPGRLVPSHGCEGQGHIAFVVSDDQRNELRQHLAACSVAIESEVAWDEGRRGSSVYVRDPAGNSVEFAPPQLWTYLRGNSS